PSPRIFAESFINSKDIPFMAATIVAIYTLVQLLDRRTLRAALIHALATGILIDIRILGIFMPAMTLAFLLLENWLETPRFSKRAITIAGLYLVCTAVVVV